MQNQNVNLSPEELAEYAEYKRRKRETEISFTLRRLIVDASRRETDRQALRLACESAKRLGAKTVLVSPVNVAQAKKLLSGSGVAVCCLVGGSGETLSSVKRFEVKKAIRLGAQEVRLVLCYSALSSGNVSCLRREIRSIRRAVKKRALSVSLEDHTVGAEQMALGVRLAAECRADSVCLPGEVDTLLLAAEVANGRLKLDCSGVENSEQLRMLVKAGMSRAVTRNGEEIAQALYDALHGEET